MTAVDACADRVQVILADPAFDDPANDESRADAIFALTGAYGWDAVLDTILSVLADDDRPQHWTDAIIVLWFGIDRPMPATRVIALLQLRLLADLPPENELDENLVWSITHTLKGVGYLSDYDPGSDPEILAEMARHLQR